MAMIGICGIISGCALLAFSFSTAGGSASPGLMAILGILIFRVSFSLSLGPIPYVVSSEVFAKGCSKFWRCAGDTRAVVV